MNRICETFRLLYYSIRSMISFIRGLYWLSFLDKPTITIFGGRGMGADEGFARGSHDLAYACIERGFSVLSGGGPGMMQAANCGAFEACQKQGKPVINCTFGIGVQGVDVDFTNECASVLFVDSFYARKWLLMHYSIAYVVFPGGVGTMDELFELLNLMKHGLIEKRPVVLFNQEYWKQMVGWFCFAIEQGFIDPSYKDFLHLSDDPKETLDFIEKSLNPKSMG